MSRGEKEVDRATMAAAKASYDRCGAAEHFFEDFYHNFFVRCPQAKPLFAHTDFERQKKLLRHAFGLLLIFPNQPAREPTILARVAERHSRRELGVDPSMYQRAGLRPPVHAGRRIGLATDGREGRGVHAGQGLIRGHHMPQPHAPISHPKGGLVPHDPVWAVVRDQLGLRLQYSSHRAPRIRPRRC
jgi:hypothetical protein